MAEQTGMVEGVVSVGDRSPFDCAMAEYEEASVRHGKDGNAARAVDAAAERVFALFNHHRARDAAFAELVDAGQRIERAIQFRDAVLQAAANGEDATSTGAIRDSAEWLETAARAFVSVLAAVRGGA